MSSPQIQAARGRFELFADLEGTPGKPRLKGTGRIREGTLRPINREEELENVFADLHFDQQRISLDTLSARQGRTGRVWSKGEVDLDGAGLRRVATEPHASLMHVQGHYHARVNNRATCGLTDIAYLYCSLFVNKYNMEQ